jgi:hypothetical protein
VKKVVTHAKPVRKPQTPKQTQKPKVAVLAKDKTTALPADPLPPAPKPTLGPRLAPIATADSAGLPVGLKVMLELLLVASLLAVAAAAVPPRALPQQVLEVVGGRRELLVFVALALIAIDGLLLFFALAVL